MCDGGIMDKSAALSDLFNQAAKTGLWAGHFDELQLHVRLMNFYLDRVRLYQCGHSSSIKDGIDTFQDGLEIGGEIDDAINDIFSSCDVWAITRVVNLEVDFWNGDYGAIDTLNLLHALS